MSKQTLLNFSEKEKVIEQITQVPFGVSVILLQDGRPQSVVINYDYWRKLDKFIKHYLKNNNIPQSFNLDFEEEDDEKKAEEIYQNNENIQLKALDDLLEISSKGRFGEKWLSSKGLNPKEVDDFKFLELLYEDDYQEKEKQSRQSNF